MLIIAVFISGCGHREEASPAYPNRPIKIIVPFAAGGGTDAFARMIKQAIEQQQLLPQPVVIVNVGGAAATIGSRRVKNARPDGYTVLLLHDAMVMSKYAGKVSFGPEAFTPVAGTAENGLVLATRQDAEFLDLRDVMAQASTHPDRLTFGCNLGTPTHFMGLLLEREQPSAAFRFVQTGDGAQRFAAVRGGHIDLTVFSNEEFLRYRSEGLRALAYFAALRHPSMPETPTAVEQGFDVRFEIMQYWWMPKGTPPERVAVFAAALRQAMQSSQLRQRLAELHTDPTYLDGTRLEERIRQLEQQVASVDLRRPLRMPNLPLWILLSVGVLSVAVVWKSLRVARSPYSVPVTRSRFDLAWMCLLMTVVYVVALSVQWGEAQVGYRAATFLFVIGVGIALSGAKRKRPARLMVIVTLAAVFSFGLFHLFTRVFVTDLP